MEQSDLFSNHSFYIADSEPSKDELATIIKNHGGRITNTSLDDNPIWLGTRENTQDAKELINPTYITDCIKHKKMLPRNKYLILGGGPASSADIRKPFTAKDKRILREWVQQQQNFGYRLGTKIYERLHEINPRHTADAWQNHWKKHIEPTLTKEQRMAYIKGHAPPDQITEDEDEDENEDEDEDVVQGEEIQDTEESVPVVGTEKGSIKTRGTDTPRGQKNKHAMTDEHQGKQEQQPPRRMTRSSTQQANTQIDKQGNGEDLLYSQTPRRMLRSSVAKQAKSDRPSSTPSQSGREVEQEPRDKGASVSASKTVENISNITPPPQPSEQLSQASQEGLSPIQIQSAMKEFMAILEEETSHQTRSRHKGKRPTVEGELENEKSNKVARLDYIQSNRDSGEVSSESDVTSVESDESTFSQCVRYVEKYLPWNGTVNQSGRRIYYYDGSRRDIGHDALHLMELSNNFFIELRDISDPRWQSYSKWSVESLQAGPHRAKSMSPDSPSQTSLSRKKPSKKKGTPKPIMYWDSEKPAAPIPNSWKTFTNIGDLQLAADKSPSRASTEIRQPPPTTSRQPSSSNSLQRAVPQHLDIIDATAIKEATHIKRALTQKTYNNVSSITDTDHKRWLMDIRGLMMDYDMTAYQIIRTLRSFSGDWEAARAFLHQLKKRGQPNATGSVSGNTRIDMLLRDRDQLTRLAWSEKQDKILKDGVQTDFDNLIVQKGRNNTLARQRFLKYVG